MLLTNLIPFIICAESSIRLDEKIEKTNNDVVKDDNSEIKGNNELVPGIEDKKEENDDLNTMYEEAWEDAVQEKSQDEEEVKESVDVKSSKIDEQSKPNDIEELIEKNEKLYIEMKNSIKEMHESIDKDINETKAYYEMQSNNLKQLLNICDDTNQREAPIVEDVTQDIEKTQDKSPNVTEYEFVDISEIIDDEDQAICTQSPIEGSQKNIVSEKNDNTDDIIIGNATIYEEPEDVVDQYTRIFELAPADDQESQQNSIKEVNMPANQICNDHKKCVEKLSELKNTNCQICSQIEEKRKILISLLDSMITSKTENNETAFNTIESDNFPEPIATLPYSTACDEQIVANSSSVLSTKADNNANEVPANNNSNNEHNRKNNDKALNTLIDEKNRFDTFESRVMLSLCCHNTRARRLRIDDNNVKTVNMPYNIFDTLIKNFYMENMLGSENIASKELSQDSHKTKFISDDKISKKMAAFFTNMLVKEKEEFLQQEFVNAVDELAIKINCVTKIYNKYKRSNIKQRLHKFKLAITDFVNIALQHKEKIKHNKTESRRAQIICDLLKEENQKVDSAIQNGNAKEFNFLKDIDHTILFGMFKFCFNLSCIEVEEGTVTSVSERIQQVNDRIKKAQLLKAKNDQVDLINAYKKGIADFMIIITEQEKIFKNKTGYDMIYAEIKKAQILLINEYDTLVLFANKQIDNSINLLSKKQTRVGHLIVSLCKEAKENKNIVMEINSIYEKQYMEKFSEPINKALSNKNKSNVTNNDDPIVPLIIKIVGSDTTYMSKPEEKIVENEESANLTTDLMAIKAKTSLAMSNENKGGEVNLPVTVPVSNQDNEAETKENNLKITNNNDMIEKSKLALEKNGTVLIKLKDNDAIKKQNGIKSQQHQIVKEPKSSQNISKDEPKEAKNGVNHNNKQKQEVTSVIEEKNSLTVPVKTNENNQELVEPQNKVEFQGQSNPVTIPENKNHIINDAPAKQNQTEQKVETVKKKVTTLDEPVVLKTVNIKDSKPIEQAKVKAQQTPLLDKNMSKKSPNPQVLPDLRKKDKIIVCEKKKMSDAENPTCNKSLKEDCRKKAVVKKSVSDINYVFWVACISIVAILLASCVGAFLYFKR